MSHSPQDTGAGLLACNAEDLGSIPGLGRSHGEGNSYPLQYSGLENSGLGRKELDTTERLSLWGFPGGSDGKESACNMEDLGLIPGWELILLSFLNTA